MEPGAWTRPDGSTFVLHEEALILDAEDTARLTVLVRELGRCQAARESCEREIAKRPTRARTPLYVYVSLGVGLFAAGLVAGTQIR